MDEADGRVRKLLEIDLFEISLVTFPMLPDAIVTDIKAIQTERDFEQFLRDAGYSKKQAIALTLHGFKALDDRRDAVVVDGEHDQAKAFSQLLEKLNTLQETLHVRGNESSR